METIMETPLKQHYAFQPKNSTATLNRWGYDTKMKYYLRVLNNLLKLKANKIRRREYIPNPREHLYIETSSLCNLECVFCAYSKKDLAKIVMPNELFFNIIDQATEMGFDDFGLTPITGEIFMDKRFFEKLEYLETHPKVSSYHFFTNFTVLDAAAILKLTALKKLSIFSISVYGHDQSSFVHITQRNDIAYRRLVDNLQTLHQILAQADLQIEIGWRTYKSFDHITEGDDYGLSRSVIRLRDSYDIPLHITKNYDNWGGIITDKDVNGLDLDVVDGQSMPKIGACSLIFYKLQVMADGQVNACACRDVNATLAIGDLSSQRLADILSDRNQTYMDLIDSQQRGEFKPICHSCSFYRSIYKYNPVYEYHSKPQTTLEEVYKTLERA